MTFLGKSEVVPIRTQRVPQTIETPVSFVSAPGAYVRFAYSRSSDSMNSQIEGQDYLCFQHNDQRLVFVVCDGVGSSFCGNLAARILGDALLEWLWTLDVTYLGGPSALNEAAVSYLNRIQKQAQLEVSEYEIPGEMSGLVRQALEAQRVYGSEAIFAACRIDHPSPMIPDGLISVMWMGDTQIHVIDEEEHEFDLGGEWNNANRWSTVQGTKGRMFTWMRELQGVGRAYAFTDGLNAHAENLAEYGDSKLDREIHAGAKLPTSDDVALVDVVLRSPIYEGFPDPDLPDFNAEVPRLEQIWNPTGANTYELRWNWNGSDKDRFIIQEATNPALTDARLIEVSTAGMLWRPSMSQVPGHYYYRVRAIKRHGGMTPWSELRLTKVAYPPPSAPKLRVDGEKPPVLVWSEEGDTIDYTLEQSGEPDFEQPEIVYTGRGTSWTVPISTKKSGMLYYRVQAISDGGPSPWSEVQEVEIRVPPPPKPTLSVGRYGHALGPYEFRWQPVPGAVRYELQRVEADRSEEEIIDVSDTNYLVPDLEPGNYSYAVRACNDYICSEWSNTQFIAVAVQAPSEAPVLEMEGPDADGGVRLSWSEVDDATEYVLELSDQADFVNARLQTQTNTFVDLQRREPGPLFIRVCGANSGGDGPWSNPVSSTVAPNAPEWLDAKVTEGVENITVTWGAVGRASYRLEMAADNSPEFREVYSGEHTSFEMLTPADAEALRFRVRADISGAQSAWWTGDAVMLSTTPPAPFLEKPTIDDKSTVRLRWQPVNGAIHYILEAAREESFATTHSSTPINDTEILFHAPTSGTYWFRIKAANKSQVSKPSASVSIKVERPHPPMLWPVDPVKANQAFEVAWKGMPNCVYYELQVSNDPAFPNSTTETNRVIHPAQKLTIPGQPEGRVYLRVRSIDDSNIASLWSDTLGVDVQ